jgi:large subunit ribosomal protein L6
MSRIGKLPIDLPKDVKITVAADNTVTVKGPKGELSQKVDPAITFETTENHFILNRPSDEKNHKAMHGLYRALLANMIHGVSAGFEVVQEVIGVGYKAEAKGQTLELALGYSHNIIFELPDEIKVETINERSKPPTIILRSIDKQLIGQVAAKIRSLRKPEPYKGKGIRFKNEVLRKKAGKSAVQK